MKAKFSLSNLTTWRDYLFIVLGLTLYALGFTAFLLPEKVVIGGIAGISSIIYFATSKYIGPDVPVVSICNFTLNAILLIFAYRVVGKQFVVRTLFGVVVLSVLIGLFQPFFTEPIVKEAAFMNVIIGAILCGIGIGIIFTHNGSSGGSDIVAAMVAKHTNITVGRTLLYVDMVIISSSFLLFHSIEKILYGFVMLFIFTYVTDLMINSNRQAVQFTILSKKWIQIADVINNQAHRGCTVLDGIGWYTKEEVKVLLVFCRKIESVTIFRIVKSIDPDAFITQGNVNGVYGKGFDRMKVKIKSDHNKTHIEA